MTAENCSKCHFSIGEDGANLVDYHEGMGADCLSCHVSSHIETCLVCHDSDNIHGSEGHFPCSQCHAGGMKKIQPELKIIAMSGGGKISADNYLETAKIFGASRIIEKPFTKKDMVSTVKELLEEV